MSSFWLREKDSMPAPNRKKKDDFFRDFEVFFLDFVLDSHPPPFLKKKRGWFERKSGGGPFFHSPTHFSTNPPLFLDNRRAIAEIAQIKNPKKSRPQMLKTCFSTNRNPQCYCFCKFLSVGNLELLVSDNSL